MTLADHCFPLVRRGTIILEFRQRSEPGGFMLRPLLIVSALLVAAAVSAAQENKDSKTPETKTAQDNKTAAKPAAPPAYQPVPVAAARQANPVKATRESIAAGKKIYSYDCALCHGDTGDGKGDAPKDMKVPDLTDPATLKDRTDGEIFYRIKAGHGDMPLEGDRVKSDQLWDIVNYVRSLAKKKAPAEEKPAAEEKPTN
jgi:mono/diheme cytochrome c family protein